MSITPPENYVYGTVVGRFLTTVVDSADLDRYPDVIAATGTVTFTPNATYYKNTALPATFITTPQVGTIDATGYLVDHRNSPGVVLMATDHSDLSPSGWTYRVTMSINGRQFTPFDIEVPAGGTVDLTTVMPAASSAGTVVVVSEAARIAAEGFADDAAVSAAQAQAIVDSISTDLEQAIEDYFEDNPVGGGVPDGGTTGQTIKKNTATNGDVSWATLTKTDVGLGSVDNTSDASKPVSTATQTALDLKANSASPTLTGTVTVPTIGDLVDRVLNLPVTCYWIPGTGWRTITGGAVPTSASIIRHYNSTQTETGVTAPTKYNVNDMWFPFRELSDG